MELSLFILILLISSSLSGILAIYLWLRRKSLESPSLSGLLLSIAIWCFGAALELAVPRIEVKRALTALCYVGITTIPVWFLLFALEFTRSKFIVNKKRLLYLLWIMPAITFSIVITNRYHHLFYSSSTLEIASGFIYQSVSPAIWWWVHTTYSYTLILIGIILFTRMLVISSSKQRGVIWLILLSCLIPLFSNMIYISGIRPLSFIDLTPIAFALTGILFFWGIYSKKFFNVRPIALNTLFDNIPDGIIVIDIDEKIVDFNQSAIEMFGLEGKSLLGQSISNILPYSFNFSNQKLFNKLHFLKQLNKNLEIVHSLIKNEYGQHIGYLIVVKDVTDRVKAEEKLKAATDRFELAIIAAGFETWENNLVTGERIGGDRIYRDLGYSGHEIPVSVEDVFGLVHPDDVERVKQSLQDHFDGKTEVYKCDFRLKDKKGNYQWVANYARVIERNLENTPTRFIGLSLNINDRKQSEERLKMKNEELVEANAEKDKFFSIIAHDLKGPFQGFIGLTELMSENIDDMPIDQLQEISHSLQITAKNLYELLDNLLSWALIKRGHKRFYAEKVKIFSIAQVVIDIVSSQVKLKGISLENRIDEYLVVLVDRESIKTVLRNLISNAIKFTPSGGSIILDSRVEDSSFVEISISDSGIGMPENIKENLFKIDKKVSRPGTNHEPSTGLGLILCKELVEKHGGNIWVESSEGKGSKFHFTLPLSS